MIEKLKLCVSPDADPFKNLALEEYLLENVLPGEIILYLWQNSNTVVIGKNQNPYGECRIDEMERDGVSLARRMSGGGAVFHDMGNLNFTFIVRREDYDVDRQLSVIIRAGAVLGVQAVKTGRNDVTAGEGRKFSGNAFYKNGDRCYHHGTIMVDVDCDRLTAYLRPSEAKLRSKGVASVRSRVVNLSELCPGVTMEQVKRSMVRAFCEVYGGRFRGGPGAFPDGEFDSDWSRGLLEPVVFSEEGRERLSVLEEKYRSREWRFGRVTDFDYTVSGKFDWGEVQLNLTVVNGVVAGVVVYTDAMAVGLADEVKRRLSGVRFSPEELRRCLTADSAVDEAAMGDIGSLIV